MENQKKTWLGSVLAAIISVFASNWESFTAKAYKKIPDELKEKVSLAVVIVENIKKFIDSPVADAITAIIPGTVDDQIKEKLRVFLPVLLDKYNALNQESLKPDASHIIATEITQELTGLSFGQSALTTEVVYQNT